MDPIDERKNLPSKSRRSLLFFLASIFLVGLFAVLIKLASVSEILMGIFKKIQHKVFKPRQSIPDDQKTVAELPSRGKGTPIETALNSRCTSDYDDDPMHFHWGMFDNSKKLAPEAVAEIIGLANIPRFTDVQIGLQSKDNLLTCFIAQDTKQLDNAWPMIESGMQQQAVALICAALGVGMVFKSLGDKGKHHATGKHATIQIKLDPMKPSYDGSFWNNSFPQGKKGWVKGNLPDPVRDGSKSLVAAFKQGNLQTKNHQGGHAAEKDIGQFLWAARGRTPHFYKSNPWGLTIPTNRGKQDITSVILYWDSNFYRYLNWHQNKPAHSISKITDLASTSFEEFYEINQGFNRAILLCANEINNIAFWEIGYQLLNLILQAYSLGVAYSAEVLDEKQKNIVASFGMVNPLAIFSF